MGFDFRTASYDDLVHLPLSFLRVYCKQLGIKSSSKKDETARRIVEACK